MQRVVSVVVFLVLFQRVVRAGSLVTLEHSLDGVNYKKAGSFQQNGKDTVVHITGYSLSNMLNTGVDARHALYSVRAVAEGSHADMEHPIASIPLSCWLHAGSKTKIDLFTSEPSSGTIQSVALHAPCPVNHAGDSVGIGPEEYALRCSISTPRIAAHVPLMKIQSSNGDALEYLDLTNQAQQAPAAQSTSRTESAKKGGAAQAKDDRTWLQKNWMFVAVGAFMLLNRMGAAAQEQQRSPASNVQGGGNAGRCVLSELFFLLTMNKASMLLLLTTLLVLSSFGVQARRMLESDDDKAARLGLIAEFKGDGTAYSHAVNNATGFACSMREIPPKAKRNFVAINSAQWNNGTDCGKCVEVWCEDSFCLNRFTPVRLMIMDLCPECSKGDLDLSIPAYEDVTGRWPHRLKFAWRYVDCSEEFVFEDQIRMDLKKGPNTWWRAFYFSGNRYPIVNVTLNGRELGRSQFNFFNDWNTLSETGPYKLTLTADTGETIETSVDDVMLPTQYLPIQFARIDE